MGNKSVLGGLSLIVIGAVAMLALLVGGFAIGGLLAIAVVVLAAALLALAWPVVTVAMELGRAVTRRSRWVGSEAIQVAAASDGVAGFASEPTDNEMLEEEILGAQPST